MLASGLSLRLLNLFSFLLQFHWYAYFWKRHINAYFWKWQVLDHTLCYIKFQAYLSPQDIIVFWRFIVCLICARRQSCNRHVSSIFYIFLSRFVKGVYLNLDSLDPHHSFLLVGRLTLLPQWKQQGRKYLHQWGAFIIFIIFFLERGRGCYTLLFYCNLMQVVFEFLVTTC